MRKQKTAIRAGALIDFALKWKSINWKYAMSQVRRLQVPIAKAVKESRWNKTKSLQYLLTRSLYAKLLAVKRVTSNKGKKTPGYQVNLMNLTRTLILLCAISLLTACATRAPQKTQWIEEALLHDGRIIHVTRAIKTGLNFAIIRLPDTNGVPKFYSVETQNPNTGEAVSWDSEDSEARPIFIDFDGTITYLVVYVPGFDNTEKKYGCIFPPYLFLRHDRGNKWVRVNPKEAPEFIKYANLSFALMKYQITLMPNMEIMQEDERERILKVPEEKRAGYQTVAKIRHENLEKEREGYLFQIDIPRSISDLKTKRKIFSGNRRFMPNRCKQFPDDM